VEASINGWRESISVKGQLVYVGNSSLRNLKVVTIAILLLFSCVSHNKKQQGGNTTKEISVTFIYICYNRILWVHLYRVHPPRSSALVFFFQIQ
jgi:hypothetical protein